jgi:hypothetical protein
MHYSYSPPPPHEAPTRGHILTLGVLPMYPLSYRISRKSLRLRTTPTSYRVLNELAKNPPEGNCSAPLGKARFFASKRS